MNIVRTGIILNTERYAECVDFYRHVFNLPTMYAKRDDDGFALTCFEFGGAYLMVETGGVAKDGEKSIEESPAKLRFNVSNIDDALQTIQAYGIEATIEPHSQSQTTLSCAKFYCGYPPTIPSKKIR
ncbi:MAG: glyoxalase/bleomycin resistance/dioxygenase family protein [Chloroflexota bacterium]